MDARPRGSGATPGPHLLDRRRRGRAPQRAARQLGFCGSLALALILGTGALAAPLDAREAYLKLLQAARDPALTDATLDAELRDFVDAVPPEDVQYGAVVRFAAGLLQRVHARALDDPALAEALAAIPSEDRRSWTIWELATARTEAGRLADAEALLRFGLETNRPAPKIAPRLWYVRSEVARLEGRWDLAVEFLDRMEASIPADASLATPANASADRARLDAILTAQNHEYRSRLAQGRTKVLIEFGLLDLAKAPANEAVAEAERSGDVSALAAARLLAFECQLVRGGSESEALAIARAACAEEALAPWRTLFRFAEGKAEIEIAHDALFRGEDAEPAAERARAALADAMATGLPPMERLKTEIALGDLGRSLGQLDEGREHLERGRALDRAMGPEGGPTDQSLQLAVLAWRLAREGGVEAAELEPARRELFEAYRRFLAQWQSTPQRPGGIGFLHVAWRAQLVSEVIEAELSAEPASDAEARAFARLLEAQAMGTHARGGAGAPVSIDALCSELLSDGQGMLVLLPARDRSHLFVLDGKGVAHRRLAADRNALLDGARRITSALQDFGRRVELEPLRTLHDQLIPPDVRARMNEWSGVVAVGFELLCGLPFGVLDGENGEPYARRFALAALPSAAFGLDLARREPAIVPGDKDLVLVVANVPPPERSLPPLRFGERERRALVEPFAEERVLLIEGADATRERLLAERARIGSARILHVLAHGTALPGREYAAALVLADSAVDTFPAEDVRTLELHGLVILSACNTGYGPPRTGDDCLVHLGGAFLDAGARCVILSRFPVEEDATLALMERLHERLAAGDVPAEALRAALAGAGSKDALAAYDATAFEVLGLGFEPVAGDTDRGSGR